jgi:hypothetical protein
MTPSVADYRATSPEDGVGDDTYFTHTPPSLFL